MRTAKDWKILKEMKGEGAWTEVIVEYADAMSGDGLWYERPLRRRCRAAWAATRAERLAEAG